MSTSKETTKDGWNPSMTYRQDKDRPFGSTTSLLEDYADESIITCWRTYKHHKNPNHKWDQEVDVAVRLSNTIDFIDNNPRAIDQVIWGLTHPDDCHPGVASIIKNPALVDLLLIRHFKAHGGIILPPLQAAREKQDAHEIVAREEIARGLTWNTGRTMMQYPIWRDNRNTTSTSDFTTPDAGRGKPSPRRGGQGGHSGGSSSRGGRGRGIWDS